MPICLALITHIIIPPSSRSSEIRIDHKDLKMERQLDILSILYHRDMDHIVKIILSHLDFDLSTICSMSLVSKDWNFIITKTSLWIGLSTRQYAADHIFAMVRRAEPELLFAWKDEWVRFLTTYHHAKRIRRLWVEQQFTISYAEGPHLNSSVTRIHYMPDRHILATGHTDGHVIIYDSRTLRRLERDLCTCGNGGSLSSSAVLHFADDDCKQHQLPALYARPLSCRT